MLDFAGKSNMGRCVSGIWSQILWVTHISWNLVPFFMGDKQFQEFGPNFYGWKIISGIWSHVSWVKNSFRSLVPFFIGETYFQAFGPILYGLKNIFRNLVPYFFHVRFQIFPCPKWQFELRFANSLAIREF